MVVPLDDPDVAVIVVEFVSATLAPPGLELLFDAPKKNKSLLLVTTDDIVAVFVVAGAAIVIAPRITCFLDKLI